MPTPTKKILVVEDEPIAAKIVAMFLDALDCDVDIASNADEALQKAAKQVFDLIIMDVGLGENQKDGVEVTNIVLSDGGKNSQTSVVSLTARDTPEDRERCKAAGILAYYVKPVKLEHIKEMLALYAK